MSIRSRLGLEQNPVFLMDGSAYIFRSFYANQNMSRADGMQTNVLYMVLRMLFKILREENPEYFGFILDGKGKNFRHRLYPEYKAHRLATPEPLQAQIPPLCEAIGHLGLKLIVSEDCEADDCIASIAARYQHERPVVIIGADKDLKQCLTPSVTLWDPSGKEERITTLQSFMEENGFGPEFWPDYQAIVGDSSDNVPGVPGIGPKGASTLMKEFKGLDEIFAKLAAVPPNLRKKLEGRGETAMLSRELTRLQLDSCSSVKLEELIPNAPAEKELMSLLADYELRALARELSSMMRVSREAGENAAPAKSQNTSAGAFSIGQAFAPKSLLAHDGTALSSGSDKKPQIDENSKNNTPDKNKPQNSFQWEAYSAGEQESLFGSSISVNSERINAVPLFSSVDFEAFSAAEVLALVLATDAGGDKKDKRLLVGDGKREFLLDLENDKAGVEHFVALLRGKEQVRLVAAGLKNILELYTAFCSIELSRFFDLSLAGWLLSPEEYDYSLRQLERLWGAEALAFLEVKADGGKSSPLPSSMIIGLEKILRDHLEGNQLTSLLLDMEMPLIPVLLKMQELGLGIDLEAFSLFLKETEKELETISSGIYQDAGHEFNIRSARQLGVILFDELGLQKGRKTTGGQASTSQEALEKLLGQHPVIEKILDYRKLEKLRSTYLDPLPKLADSRHRLHTSFNQSSTATGRLSSSNPNLQNIPVRGPLGGRMRACFTAAPGNLLVSADYSQIELRVLAHLSQDPALLDAFRNGEDIHRRTACLLFDCEADQVTPDQRRNAKTINFGLVYGMGPQKLAQDLGIGMKEAKEFISRYFEKLGKLKQYFEQVEEDAKKHGFVCTMTGRRRLCPEILSANQQLRSRARRQAINTCIQGSAADIIKLAMLAVAADERLKELGAGMILQIHDELLLECAADRAEPAGARLKEIMEAVKPGGITMSVPLLADAGLGVSWAEAH